MAKVRKGRDCWGRRTGVVEPVDFRCSYGRLWAWLFSAFLVGVFFGVCGMLFFWGGA